MFCKFYFRRLKVFVNIGIFKQRMASNNQHIMLSVNFEIHGKVQGVFFRKNTKSTAEKYGLVGWVRNTRHGTVEGQLQGKQDQVNIMKTWLKETGSKRSVITRADFKNEKEIAALTHDTFVVRK